MFSVRSPARGQLLSTTVPPVSTSRCTMGDSVFGCKVGWNARSWPNRELHTIGVTNTQIRDMQLAVREYRTLQPNTRTVESLTLARLDGHYIHCTHERVTCATHTVGRESRKAEAEYAQ